MMEETPKKKKTSFELTKKGKVILIIVGIVIVLTILIAVFLNTRGIDANLSISASASKNQMSSMTISPGNNTGMSLKPSSEVSLTYKYDDNKDHGVKWIVSDEKIAKIEGNKLKGLGTGTVKVYAVSKKDKNIKSNSVTITFK